MAADEPTRPAPEPVVPPAASEPTHARVDGPRDSGPAAPATASEPAEAAPPAPPSVAHDAEPPRETPAPPPPPVRRAWAWQPEPEEEPVTVPRSRLRAQSRRDFLLFGLAAAATAIGGWWLLPDRARSRLVPGALGNGLDALASRVGLTRARRERTLDRALTFDDDVAEALFSKDRSVRTYARSEATPLRNNYAGLTPGPDYLPTWTLQLSGLASGRTERLTIGDLLQRFPRHEQVTRLVCVEGWSAVAWWEGIRFGDVLNAFPPAPGARWAALRSAVNLDARGNPDPYYVSIDLETARHPQALLATHLGGQPLTVAHGAPLRLVVPMKLGLKNIKAISDIAYGVSEPPDYWNQQGYSRYDGL